MQIDQPFRINAAQPDKLKQFLPKPLIISSPALIFGRLRETARSC